MIGFYIAAVAIFAIYIITTWALFFFKDRIVPESLSATFYYYKEKFGTGWPFQVALALGGFCTMVYWIDIAELTGGQYLAFLAAVGFIAVGFAPMFKSGGTYRAVHMGGAILSAVASIAYVLFYTTFQWLPFIYLISIDVIAIFTRTLRRSFVFWLEAIAILTIYTVLPLL